MSGRKYRVVVVGATGLVGVELIEALGRRRFPIESLSLFSSINSAGDAIEFSGSDVEVEQIRAGYHQDSDLVFFATHPLVSRDLAPEAAKAGAIVIDASKQFRLDPAAAMIVPEVNGAELARVRGGGRIIASPAPGALALALLLAPLDRKFGVKALSAVTVHGTTTGGRRGVEEHQGQTIALFNQSEVVIEKFPRQAAFNVFPRVGEFVGDGDAEAEREIKDELPRLLGSRPALSVTAMMAPVFCGLAAAVSMELAKKTTVEDFRAALREAQGLQVMDDPEQDEYPDTLRAMEHEDALVGRVRPDPSRPNGISVWLSVDNLRRGAADNMVAIAEAAVKLLD